MSAPPIQIAARPGEGSVIPVDWRIGFAKPKGVVHVTLPDDIAPELRAPVAELTAIRYLVDNRRVGTSMRPHEVVVTQPAIKALMDRKADNSALVPFGRHLYLYVDERKLSVAKPTWTAAVEVDPERVCDAIAFPAAWPGGECPAMGETVGITRHAVERFIERCATKQDHWHAFHALLKRLSAPHTRVVPHEETAKTNPGMRRDANTMVMHHQPSDLAMIIVREEEGLVMVTVHAHFQEYVPTFVRGRVEYRRNDGQ